MFLKQSILSFVETAAGCLPLAPMMRISGAGPLVLYYHVVSDDPIQHVAPLFRYKTVPEFEADLEWLLSHLPVLGLDDVIEAALGNGRRRGFFLTFDDGLREMSEIVAPILKRKGVPAAFFLCSGFWDNRDLFYRFKAALILGRLQSAKQSALAEAGLILERRGLLAEGLAETVRSVTYLHRFLLDEIAPIFELDFATYLRECTPFMSIDEAAALQRDGFAIGAHSIDHPRYAEIPLEEQIRQTRQSVEALEALLHPPHRIFAFPFMETGVNDAFYVTVRDEELAEAVFGTGGWFHDPTRRLIDRVSLEGYKPGIDPFLRRSLGPALLKRLVRRDL
jgi:peptidoglycan/xylan/chitin deacetylase (PgdA/CDA1 family)